jgi:hypothetical protein
LNRIRFTGGSFPHFGSINDPPIPQEVSSNRIYSQLEGDVSWATASTRSGLSGLATNQAIYLTESGREGVFIFDSSNRSAEVSADTVQGLYVAPANNPTGAAGAWVRRFSGPVNIQWFGPDPAGVAISSGAFLSAIATLKVRAVNNVANLYKGSQALFIPAGLYNLGTTTLDISHTLIIEGESTINGRASRLKWTGDCDGIRVQAYNTSGASTVDGPHFSGSFATIRNLGLAGPYEDNPDFTGHTEGEFHAINVRSNIIIEDVFIDGWSGDGVHANTSVGGGGANEGNSNVSFVNRLRVTNVRNGVFIDGADANAWTLIGVYGTYCRQHTVWDSSFLGNTHIGHHSANAGLVPGVPASVVSYSGNRYYVKQGQAAGASTNAPSGTSAANTWWRYIEPGAPASWLNIPTWTSGLSVREGGGFRTDNLNGYNTFIGCYQEGGEGLSQFVSPTVVLGGIINADTSGNFLRGDKLVAPNGVALGQSRIASGSTTRTLAIHNSQALSGGITASINFEQGYETDGVTPANIGAIGAWSTSNNPETAAGILEFKTRTFGGTGGMTTWLQVDGNSQAFRPVTDNNFDSGQTSTRWKTGYFYTVNAATAVTSAGPITSTGGGVGYATGAGGAVTQATSKSTGVTLNKLCGQILTSNAALAASVSVEFTVNNSQVAATDAILVALASGDAGVSSYTYWVSAVTAGLFKITIYNRSAVTKSDKLLFNFAVLKGVNA